MRGKGPSSDREFFQFIHKQLRDQSVRRARMRWKISASSSTPFMPPIATMARHRSYAVRRAAGAWSPGHCGGGGIGVYCPKAIVVTTFDPAHPGAAAKLPTGSGAWVYELPQIALRQIMLFLYASTSKKR